MLPRFVAGDVRSAPVVLYYLVANILLNGLNISWGYKILLMATRPREPAKRA